MVQLRLAVILTILSIIHSSRIAVSAAAITTPLTTIQLSAFRASELKKHNQYRAKHGCQPLVVNKTLEAIAQAYANNISKLHLLAHSPNASSGKYGENLYWTWGSPNASYNGIAASDSWYSENVNYVYKTGTASPVGKTIGHFTAMIWNSTRTVGFGIVKIKQDRNVTITDPKTGKKTIKSVAGEAFYIVANYYVPPNVAGQYVKNVPAPK